MKEVKDFQYFSENFLSKLIEDHKVISLKSDFKKMCQKWGKGYLDYLDAAYTAFKNDDGMSEEEFLEYNGIPDYYKTKLKLLEVYIKYYDPKNP